MTDRLHACKESPDGRHEYGKSPMTSTRCLWCGKPKPTAKAFLKSRA